MLDKEQIENWEKIKIDFKKFPKCKDLIKWFGLVKIKEAALYDELTFRLLEELIAFLISKGLSDTEIREKLGVLLYAMTADYITFNNDRWMKENMTPYNCFKDKKGKIYGWDEITPTTREIMIKEPDKWLEIEWDNGKKALLKPARAS